MSAEDEVVVISIIPEFIQGETYKLYALCYKALKVVSIKNNKDYEKIVVKLFQDNSMASLD